MITTAQIFLILIIFSVISIIYIIAKKMKRIHNVHNEGITSYYIDDNNVLHTYIGEKKHITMSEVYSTEQAEELIEELENEL